MMSTDQTTAHVNGDASEFSRYRVITFGKKAQLDISEYDISEDELSENEVTRKRKRDHCYSHHQIKVMEDCFKICRRPNNNRIAELAAEIGLDPLLVKSWFRYERAQIKRDENNNLPPPPPSSPEYDLQLLNSAIKEFVIMAQTREPLWIVQPSGESQLLLNQQEYSRMFEIDLSTQLRQGYKYEASRDSAIVMMEASKVADIFTDMDKWSTVFSSMIDRAMSVQFLPAATVVRKPTSLKMYAKFKVVCPIVPTRNCTFVRRLRKRDEQTFAVLDVSFDYLDRYKCFKRPSGCLIQAMPNNHSKITWIEHVEVEDHQLIHNVSSEYAYGAKRWLSILERYCERHASVTGLTNYPYYAHLNGIGLPSPVGRNNILNLAEKMVTKFCGGSISCPFSDHPWKKIWGGDGFDQVRIKTRKCEEYPEYNGKDVLCAEICCWIPILPKNVFNFLQNSSTRAKFDKLIYGEEVQEIITIKNGKEAGNCVSVLQLHNVEGISERILFLKESSTDATSSSFIVNASIDERYIRKLCKGENVNELPPLLPFGFTILPSGPPAPAGAADATIKGTLLTAAFQRFVEPSLLSTHEVAQNSNVIEFITKTIKNDLVYYLNQGGT